MIVMARDVGNQDRGEPMMQPHTIIVRGLSDDAYEKLRRLAFERRQTYAQVIEAALEALREPK